MIPIFITNRKINIYEFDDAFTVLKRYVLDITSTDNNKNVVLPQYLRFKNEPETFKKSGRYEVEYLQTEISKLTLPELSEPKTLYKLHARYPLLDTNKNNKSIAYLWLIENGYGDIPLKKFIKIFNDNKFKYYFNDIYPPLSLNPGSTHTAIVKFKSDILNAQKDVFLSLKKETEIFLLLSKLVKSNVVECDPFQIEEISTDIILNLPNNQSIYEIFDLLDVSEHIPFIMLNDVNDTYYKIHQNIIPPDNWLIPFHTDHKSIFFYILTASLEKLYNILGINRNNFSISTSSGGNISQLDKLYSLCSWQEENVIQVSLEKLSSSDSSIDVIKNQIFNNFNDRVKYEITDDIQVGIKGKFAIQNIVFNPAVFMELIMNNDICSYFLFTDERKKPALSKERFVFYYIPNQTGDTTNSLTITATSMLEKSVNWLEVRVAHALSIQQVNSFMSVFKQLISLYLHEYNKIVKDYEKLYANVKFNEFVRKPEKHKVNKKTGERLMALEQYNPAAFKAGKYSTKCQRRQPYIVRGEAKVKAKKKELSKLLINGKTVPNLADDGMVEWPKNSGDYYVCAPRQGITDDPRAIWAGVIKQDPTSSNYAEYPYLPCCFVVNQRTKKKSDLKDYMSDKAADDGGDIDEGIDQVKFDRPLAYKKGAKKIIPRGRFGELPYFMRILATISGYESVEFKTKMFLPILRYGVYYSPNSFIYCMKTAFSSEFRSMSIDAKKEEVELYLEKLSSQDDEYFVTCRQEMYDYSYQEIKDKLVTNAYIDPELFVNLLAKDFDCNIILFQVNDKYPDGNIVIPRHSIAYLPYKLNVKSKTVIIIKTQTDQYWDQCELVVKYNIKSDKVKFYFDDKDDFMLNSSNILSDANIVYTINPDNYSTYTPSVTI